MAASAASAWAPHAQAWVATSSRLISKGVAFRTERSDVSFECACSCSQAEPEDYSRSGLQLWNVRRGHRSRGLQQMQAARLDGFSFSSRETNESKEVVGRSFLSESVSSDLLATFKLVENILYAESSNAEVADDGRKQLILKCLKAALPLFASLPAILGFESSAYARDLGHLNPAYGEVGAFLELGVQLIYLGLLLLFLGVGTFLVVRQVLVRRELETAAKELQERVRTGEASSEEYYELGAIFLRKKLFTQANKYLEQAIKKWDGDDQDLAQVYNALGFSCYSDDDVDGAIVQYLKAVKLQPGYVTAWNNLGDAYEKKKEYKSALKAYQEALQFDPSNKIASTRRDAVKKRVDMFQGIPD